MKITSITQAGSQINEDAIFISNELQAVIDGASGLTLTSLQDTTEARELARAVALALKTVGDIPVSSIPYELQRKISHTLTNTASAAIALAKVSNFTVQFLLLGDCTILLETVHGGVHVYHDNRVTALDSLVLKEITEMARRMDLPLSEMMQYAIPKFKEHRQLLNMPKGYDAFSLEHNLTDRALIYSFPRNVVKRYIIMSDGWEDLISTFGIVPSPAAMLELCCKPNALEILSTAMRTVANLDLQWIAYPRLKHLDDFSCIVVEL